MDFATFSNFILDNTHQTHKLQLVLDDVENFLKEYGISVSTSTDTGTNLLIVKMTLQTGMVTGNFSRRGKILSDIRDDKERLANTLLLIAVIIRTSEHLSIFINNPMIDEYIFKRLKPVRS
jgi:hypothetical protein